MNKNLRILLGVIGFILLIYVLWNVRTIIYYFFTAAIIAFIGRPLVALMGRIQIREKKLPNWLKSLLVLASFVLLLFGFFQMIIPTVISQANIISQIDPTQMVEKFQPQIQAFTSWMERFDVDQSQVEEVITQEFSRIFEVGEISDVLTSFIGGLTDSLIAVFSILFISFFLLKDGTIVDNVVTSLTPDKYIDSINKIFNKKLFFQPSFLGLFEVCLPNHSERHTYCGYRRIVTID